MNMTNNLNMDSTYPKRLKVAKRWLAGLLIAAVLVFFCVVFSQERSFSKMAGPLSTLMNLVSIFSIFIIAYGDDGLFSKEKDGFIICVGYGFFGAIFGFMSYHNNDWIFLIALAVAIFFSIYLLFRIHNKKGNNDIKSSLLMYFIMLATRIIALLLIIIAVSLFTTTSK